MELATKRRSELKAQAHSLEPVVQIGKFGVTPKVLAHIDKALDNHQLIKVKFIDFKEARLKLSEEMARATSSILIDIIGNVAILYREKQELSN